jgi:hypothetical protein
MSRIRVTIDRVCLAGLEAAERTALIEGLQGELERTLALAVNAGGVKSRRTPVLRLGRMPMSSGRHDSRDVGVRIARAIGKSLKP